MNDLVKILIWGVFILLAFALQTNHFLSLGGINPNLILLAVSGGVILEKKFRNFLGLILAIIFLSVIFWPYWLKEILVLSGLGSAAFLFKKFLTGSAVLDFLILILIGTLGFYLMANFRYFPANPAAIAAELFYNISLGGVLVVALKLFQRQI